MSLGDQHVRPHGGECDSSNNHFRMKMAGSAAYGMSKAAIDMFTKNLALELAPEGVRVSAVNPGYVPTEIHRNLNFNTAQYKAHLDGWLRIHPIGRLGTPEDVARAVAFLASDKSSFITGETLFVDGAARYGGNLYA